jgi:hypothetical protein
MSINADQGSKLWSEVERVLLVHYYEPELQGVPALCAAIAAHKLRGQPVWPMVVAPAGSMKTDLLAGFDGLPTVHLIDSMTPNTFLSGQIKDAAREKRQTSSSLLHRIGASGFIVFPDFGTVLSMNKTHRGSVLADMRRIYDGHLRKEYGTDDDRLEHEWRGRITCAVGTTDAVDRHYAVFQALGERFVMIRWDRPDGVKAAIVAINQDREACTTELRKAIHSLICGLSTQEPRLSSQMQYNIAALAEFTVRARTHISRSRYNKEIEYVPEPEAPTRLAQQLAQLAKGSALVMERSEVDGDDLALVRRVAFDCIPTARRKLLDALISGEKGTGAASTISYAKQELKELGLLNTGHLSSLALELLRQAGVL